MSKFFKETDDPVEVKKILQQRHLCYLLSPRLKIQDKMNLSKDFYIMAVEINGQMRSALSCGLYKRKQVDSNAIFINEYPGAASWLAEGDVEILEVLLQSPLCFIVSEDLTPKQIYMMQCAYDMKLVEYKGKERYAIMCVYYDPKQQLKGRVLRQELIDVKMN